MKLVSWTVLAVYGAVVQTLAMIMLLILTCHSTEVVGDWVNSRKAAASVFILLARED